MRVIRQYLQIVATVVVVGYTGSAQAAAPVAGNGFGLKMSEYFGRSRGMGEVGLSNADGINLLIANPALLSATGQYTFGFGATYSHENTDTSLGSESNARTNSDFLTLAVPLFKGFAVGWSLAPVTRTDVKMLMRSTINSIRIDDNLNMTGGLNISAAGFGVSFRNIVRIGYSMNYYFGNIQEEWIRSFPQDVNMVASRFYLKRKYSGYSHTIGAIVTPLEWLSLAVSYTTDTTLDDDNTVVIGSLANDDMDLSNSTSKLPAVIRGGLYTSISDRFEGGIDVTYENWEEAAVTSTETMMYNDTFKIGAGLRYVPVTRPGTPYLKTLPLTLGVRTSSLYYKSYPVVDTVSEKALSMGIEFPLKDNFGSVFTTVEAGLRGDKSSNGWEQMFVGFTIALIGKTL